MKQRNFTEVTSKRVVVWCRIKLWSNTDAKIDKKSKLWFDVESKYEATSIWQEVDSQWLWFDVESKYEATVTLAQDTIYALWFDVESKYEATIG